MSFPCSMFGILAWIRNPNSLDCKITVIYSVTRQYSPFASLNMNGVNMNKNKLQREGEGRKIPSETYTNSAIYQRKSVLPQFFFKCQKSNGGLAATSKASLDFCQLSSSPSSFRYFVAFSNLFSAPDNATFSWKYSALLLSAMWEPFLANHFHF